MRFCVFSQKCSRRMKNSYKLEHELADRLAKQEAEATTDEIKRQVTQLLADAGIEVRRQVPHSNQEVRSLSAERSLGSTARSGRTLSQRSPFPM
jgi:hypothetical protein